MSEKTSTKGSQPVLKVYQPGNKVSIDADPLEDMSFGTESEISQISDHENRMVFLQYWPNHKLMSAIPGNDIHMALRKRNKIPASGSVTPSRPTPKSELSPFISQFDDYMANKDQDDKDHLKSSYSNFKSKASQSSSSQNNIQRLNFDVNKASNTTISKSVQNTGDDGVESLDRARDAFREEKEETESRQDTILDKYKKALHVGSGPSEEKIGWDFFAKNARARARINSAFIHALDHVLFDATAKELDVIGDKTYFNGEKKFGRRSLYKRRSEAPKLRKILEKHGIISKKNLEKKALKRVLNNIMRRKSKMNYMRGNI